MCKKYKTNESTTASWVEFPWKFGENRKFFFSLNNKNFDFLYVRSNTLSLSFPDLIFLCRASSKFTR